MTGAITFMEAKTMDKQSLPKLETEGFTIVSAQRASVSTGALSDGVSWRERASGLMRRVGIPGSESLRPGKQITDVDPAYKKLLIKTGICAGVAIVLLVVSSIGTPVTQDITNTINQVVNHEFDIDKDIGRLKFVKTLDESRAVFSAGPGVLATYPADGKIVTRYGEGGSKGVRIDMTGNAACIAKGTVTAVGEIGNMGYVKIELDTGETLVYHNVMPAVQVNDIVMPGQTVGAVSGEYLYLEMMDGEEYIDPITYIEQRVAAVLQ
jgi:hypothetical protein